LEDRIQVSAAAKGDQAAFTALVERYRGYVYTIAYKITLNEDDALDVAQTVFLRLVERIGDFDGRGPFRRWLATIAVRESITHRRRAARRETPFDPATMDEMREGRGGGWDCGGGSGDGSVDGVGGVGAAASLGAGGASAGSSGESPRDRILRLERRDRVEAAMGELSPQQRAIFALRFKEDMDSAEIAERLDIPPGQARVQLCRAVARLRELVGED